MFVFNSPDLVESVERNLPDNGLDVFPTPTQTLVLIHFMRSFGSQQVERLLVDGFLLLHHFFFRHALL